MKNSSEHEKVTYQVEKTLFANRYYHFRSNTFEHSTIWKTIILWMHPDFSDRLVFVTNFKNLPKVSKYIPKHHQWQTFWGRLLNKGFKTNTMLILACVAGGILRPSCFFETHIFILTSLTVSYISVKNTKLCQVP